MDESEKFVKSCLTAKASQALQEEVEKELSVQDPSDKTIASLVGENNECTNKHKSCGCRKNHK